MLFIFWDFLRPKINCSISPSFVCSCYVFCHTLFTVSPYACCLIDRYSVGERCLTEETPPILSETSPPGRLLLLADRHAGRPGAHGCLPQCGHQEEFHSVTPGSSHFIIHSAEEGKCLAADTAPKWIRVGSDAVGDCWPARFCITDKIFYLRSVNKAVVPAEEVLWINWLNTNNYRLQVTGL